MSTYLNQAKEDFERAMGDVTSDYGDYLLNKTKIQALLAVAEQLQQLTEMLEGRLDAISGDLQNIDYELEIRRQQGI